MPRDLNTRLAALEAFRRPLSDAPCPVANAALNWLLNRAAPEHTEIVARIHAAHGSDRNALAAAVIDLAEAAGPLDAFMDRFKGRIPSEATP